MMQLLGIQDTFNLFILNVESNLVLERCEASLLVGSLLLKNALIPYHNLVRKLIWEAFSGKAWVGGGGGGEEFSAIFASSSAWPLQGENDNHEMLAETLELFICL